MLHIDISMQVALLPPPHPNQSVSSRQPCRLLGAGSTVSHGPEGFWGPQQLHFPPDPNGEEGSAHLHLIAVEEVDVRFVLF